MGIIQRQSIKGTIYSYIGVVLGFVTTGLMYPFILDEGEIGVLKLLMSYSALAAQIAGLGFNGVTVRLFPYFRDPKTAHKGFLFLGLIITAIGLVISLGGLALLEPWIIEKSAAKSALFTQYFFLIFPLIVFQLLFAFLDNYYTQLYNSTFAIFLKELVQRSLIIASILVFYLGYIDFSQFVYLFVIMVSFPTLLLIFQIYRDKELRISTNLKHIDSNLRKQIIEVSLFSILTSFTGVIILNIDSIMLSYMVGIGATGIYAINYFFGVLVKVPIRPMVKISNAVISESWKKNDIANIKDIYNKSTLSQLIVGSFLFLGVLINIDSIYQYLPEAYEQGKYVLIFIGLASCLEMATGVSKSVIGTSKYYKVQSLAMVGLAVLVVITNYIFIPLYGVAGAGFASFVSLFIFNAFRYFFIWFKFKMQPYNYKHGLVVVIAVGLFFISKLLPMTNNYFIDIPYRSLIITILYAISVYSLNISPEVNGIINKGINLIRRK
jgi:O-antigen/teichoic acid export membrane protein